MSTPESQSMIDVLRSAHRSITEQFHDPANLGDDDDALTGREDLVITLVGHLVAEEQYLYPTVREHLDDGGARADACFDADRRIEHRLRSFEDDDLTGGQLAATWADVRSLFGEHVAQQEALFAELPGVCSPQQLAELADEVLGAEQLAPTRPRRFAPESPAANKVVSFVEGFIDRARDYYTKRGVDED